jgi:hypothetical protein
MRFVPFMVRYETEFESWPTEGSIATPSHLSEGWHEKGHTGGQYLDARSVESLLKPCSSPGRFVVREFFSEKGNKPSGLVKQTQELFEPTVRNF